MAPYKIQVTDPSYMSSMIINIQILDICVKSINNLCAQSSEYYLCRSLRNQDGYLI